MKESIDLRSDSCTLPSDAMRRAMAEAPVGMESWGEDPTANRLVDTTCALLGKEAGLLTGSCTAANLVALLTWAELHPNGSEVIAPEYAHTYCMETAGASRLAGLSVRPIDCREQYLPLELIQAAVRPNGMYSPRTALIWVENSYMLGGGIVVRPDEMAALYGFANNEGISLHLDGARLLNAACALNTSPAALARYSDSVSLSFAKGIGAPAGAILCGDRAFIARARRNRALIGGGLGMAGIHAAAALVGLREADSQMEQDHRNARAFATGLAECCPTGIDIGTVQTNIVLFDPRARNLSAQQLCDRLKSSGILALSVQSPWGPRCRFVFHNGVHERQIPHLIQAVAQIQ